MPRAIFKCGYSYIFKDKNQSLSGHRKDRYCYRVIDTVQSLNIFGSLDDKWWRDSRMHERENKIADDKIVFE